MTHIDCKKCTHCIPKSLLHIFCKKKECPIEGAGTIMFGCTDFEQKGDKVETKKTAKYVVPGQLVSEIADSRRPGAYTGVVEIEGMEGMDTVENIMTNKAVFWITRNFHTALENKIEESEKFDMPTEELPRIMNFDKNTIRDNDFIIEDGGFRVKNNAGHYKMYLVSNPSPLMIKKWTDLFKTVENYIENGFCVWIHC